MADITEDITDNGSVSPATEEEIQSNEEREVRDEEESDKINEESQDQNEEELLIDATVTSNSPSVTPDDLPATQLNLMDTPTDTSPVETIEETTLIPYKIITETIVLQATPETPSPSNKENTTSVQKKPATKKMAPVRAQSSPSVGRPAVSKTTPPSGGRRKGSAKKTFQPTVPKPFNFCLDQRLEVRGEYDKRLKSQREAFEEKERRDKERREKEEEEELKSIRKSLVHKARPIQYYNPITVVPSEKPLTVPEPPNLVLGNRNRVRDKQTA